MPLSKKIDIRFKTVSGLLAILMTVALIPAHPSFASEKIENVPEISVPVIPLEDSIHRQAQNPTVENIPSGSIDKDSSPLSHGTIDPESESEPSFAAAAPDDNTTLITAATQAAHQILSDSFNHHDAVVLKNFTEHSFDPAIADVRGYYTADVEGTNYAAWGLLKQDGTIITSGISQNTDSGQAVQVIVREFAMFFSTDSKFNPRTLSNHVRVEQKTGKLSEALRFSLLNTVLDVYKKTGLYGKFDNALFEHVLGEPSFSQPKRDYLINRIKNEWDASPAPYLGLKDIPWIIETAALISQSFDVNKDGAIDDADMDLIEDTWDRYAWEANVNHQQAAFPQATRDVFGPNSIASTTQRMRSYFTAPTIGAKLILLFDILNIRNQYGNPGIKESVFSFVAPEVLSLSAQGGPGSPGYEIKICNFALVYLISTIKAEGKTQYFEQIRQLLDQKMVLYDNETADLFRQRKELAMELWDRYKVFVEYEPNSFGTATGENAVFQHERHLKYLDQIKNLIAGMATPFIQQHLDVIAIHPSTWKGFGSQGGVFITSLASSVLTVVHEMTHITAAKLGFPQFSPPEYTVLFEESANEDFPTSYHTNPWEDFAELAKIFALDSAAFLQRALGRSLEDKLLLFEKFLSLDKMYPRDSEGLKAYKINEETGEVATGYLTITRDAEGRLTQLTVAYKTYNIHYDPISGRLQKVEKQPELRLGDVTQDGRWTEEDADLIQQHFEAVKSGNPGLLTPEQQFLADADGDQRITLEDVLIVKGLGAGLITSENLPAKLSDINGDDRWRSLEGIETLQESKFGEGSLVYQRVLNGKLSEKTRLVLRDQVGKTVEAFEVKSMTRDNKGTVTAKTGDEKTIEFKTNGTYAIEQILPSNAYGTLKQIITVSLRNGQLLPKSDQLLTAKEVMVRGKLVIQYVEVQKITIAYDVTGRKTQTVCYRRMADGSLAYVIETWPLNAAAIINIIVKGANNPMPSLSPKKLIQVNREVPTNLLLEISGSDSKNGNKPVTLTLTLTGIVVS